MCPQVRCAAVFALGTFVGNSGERTDHSTTIDHNVAMMLAQLINDGSPVVRKVRTHARTDTHARTHTHTHTRTHSRTHTHTYRHRQTHTQTDRQTDADG